MKTQPGNFKARCAVFCLIAIAGFVLSACGSSKGFKVAIETGGDADQRNVGAASDQANFFVSDDTKALPEITGDECEQLGDAFLNKGKLYLAYVQYEKYCQDRCRKSLHS